MQTLHATAIFGTVNPSWRSGNYLRTTDTDLASEALNYSPPGGSIAVAFPCANEILLFHFNVAKNLRVFNLNLVRFQLIAYLNRRTNWRFDGSGRGGKVLGEKRLVPGLEKASATGAWNSRALRVSGFVVRGLWFWNVKQENFQIGGLSKRWCKFCLELQSIKGNIFKEDFDVMSMITAD